MWKTIKPYIIGFVIGIIIACGIIFFASKGSGDKLNVDLRAAKWSMESVSRLNTELTARLRSVSGELIKSNNTITEQQSILNGQQSIISKQQSVIDNQKSIIDGIIATINGTGNDIREKIKSIADIGRLLYNYYN